MDNETAEKFAAIEAELALLKSQLAERAAPEKVITLKRAAFDLGVSVETARRRVLHDPDWRKQGGRWIKHQH